MNKVANPRGAAPVGHIADLDALETAAVLYFRMWNDGPDSKVMMQDDFAAMLGTSQGASALASFQQLCELCARHGRRPLVRHSVSCSCLGSDESCMATFISAAASGDHEDAMLIATLLVRADMAPVITSLAAEFGYALKRMQLSTPEWHANPPPVSQALH